MEQLFIGRLPRSFRSRELEDIFYKYGRMTRCDVKQGEFLFFCVPVIHTEHYVYISLCVFFLSL